MRASTNFDNDAIDDEYSLIVASSRETSSCRVKWATTLSSLLTPSSSSNILRFEFVATLNLRLIVCNSSGRVTKAEGRWLQRRAILPGRSRMRRV